mgnify:CR=1 FL=1
MSWSYKHIGDYDTSNLLEFIDGLTNDEWTQWTFKQNSYARVHHNTNTIPVLVDHEYELRRGKETKYYKLLESEILKIEEVIKTTLGDGTTLRIEIAKLKSNTIIPEHVDTGNSLVVNSRIHLPLITNKNCVFKVNGVEKVIPVGELWEINNGSLHGVTNLGEDRVHMIIDFKKSPKVLI